MKDLPPPKHPRLEIVLFSGDSMVFGRLELVRALFHRYVVIHYVLVGFFLTLVDTRSGLPRTSFNDQAAIITFSISAAIVVLAIFALGLELIARSKGLLRITASPILAIAAVLGVLAGDLTEYLVVDRSVRWGRTLLLSLFYYVLVETVAHLIVLVIFPRVLRDFREREAARRPEPPSPAPTEFPRKDMDHIEISGRRIATATLERIVAEGNYLRVFAGKERLYLPGPFGEAVDHLPEWLGVRVSRSDWVAIRAVCGIRREGREMQIDLRDGTSVRVAGSRQKVVLSLLDLPVQRGRVPGPDQGAAMERSIQRG